MRTMWHGCTVGTNKRKGVLSLYIVNGFEFETNEKYLKKLDYDLAGSSFHLVMDNGKEILLQFLTGEIIAFSEGGAPLTWERYGGLKLDDNTWLVAFEKRGLPERTCVSVVLDLENSLVTVATTRQNVVPERPRLAFCDIVFGTIKREGQELPIARHHYTDDLVGKKITWTYANGFVNTHIYTSASGYRIRPLDAPEGDSTDAWNHDEPARYVKIKEDVYLLSFIEENINKMDPLKGGNNLIVLANVKTMKDVGRIFIYNSRQQPEFGMMRAYGVLTDEPITSGLTKSPFKI